MIKVEITESQKNVVVRSGKTKDGRDYQIREQNAYIYLGGDYPAQFTIPVPQGQVPYPPGFYELHESSIVVGEYNRLKIARIVLTPLNTNEKSAK